MYRLITNDYNEIVGDAEYDEKTGKVLKVRMFDEVYTDPEEWKKKFNLPEKIV